MDAHPDLSLRSTTVAFRRPDAHAQRLIAELNERCLDVLMLLAKRGPPTPRNTLALHLRPLLRSVRPDVRRRAAQIALPLIDMEFRNSEWWQALKSDSGHCSKHSPPDVPKRAMVQLTRATLIFCWHSVHTDLESARVLFGMSPTVADIIGALRLADIEQIAERQFRHLRPRWQDRPWLWRKLLNAAHSNDHRVVRDFHVHALQVLVGESIPRTSQSNSDESARKLSHRGSQTSQTAARSTKNPSISR
jgi:hypothetical protein